MTEEELKRFLDAKVITYDQPAFIPGDPVSIPHRFKLKQDIEIAGLFAAVFSWGNRTTIIQKSSELMNLMDNAPHSFCKDHRASDLKRMLQFRHRTFNTTDLLYFIAFLGEHYRKHSSLESAFSNGIKPGDPTVENGLCFFHDYFFSLEDPPPRTRKHIATPKRSSTCKRLNMFLRWMVRNDKAGVDFGIWESISPAQLVCPIDVHVARVARHLGLLQRKQTDWASALELTERLRKFDKDDPVRYDYALFGMGVNGQ